MGASEWPVDEPKAKLPVWKKKDSFLSVFFDHKVVVAHCPTGSGKSTILPALAAMHLHPQAGRVCCTQIRRVTTQSVSRNTKDIWNIDRESLVVGYQHGTEPQEHWNQHQTKVLFLTEGIVMRQVMSHDEHTHPETILPGCRVLMLDEAHSGSTDIELILARILPMMLIQPVSPREYGVHVLVLALHDVSSLVNRRVQGDSGFSTGMQEVLPLQRGTLYWSSFV